jgi:hypothetical protein
MVYSDKVIALEDENATLKTEVAVAAPKAAALDRLTDADGAFNVRSAEGAKGEAVGPRRPAAAEGVGIPQRRGGAWRRMPIASLPVT